MVDLQFAAIVVGLATLAVLLPLAVSPRPFRPIVAEILGFVGAGLFLTDIVLIWELIARV